MIFLKCSLRFVWKICRNHVKTQIVAPSVKRFIFAIDLWWAGGVEPNCNNLTIIMHFLNKGLINKVNLEVTTFSELVGAAEFLISPAHWLAEPIVLGVNGPDFLVITHLAVNFFEFF